MISKYTFTHRDDPSAFFIIPESNPLFHKKAPGEKRPKAHKILHQFGCVSCKHFEIKGRLEPVPPDIGLVLESLLDCRLGMGYEHLSDAKFEKARHEIEEKTGLQIKRVLGESIVELLDGRFVVTENCD